jgi:multidrug resistance efflux pump
MIIGILLLAYMVGLYLVFVQFRLWPFTLPMQLLAGSVGVLMLLVIVLAMNYSQPYSIGVTYSSDMTPVVARVAGRVIEVPIKENAPLKQGDVLFRIDPQPYVDSLHQAEGALAQADIQTSTSILQATQGVDAATAGLSAATASAAAAAANVKAVTANVGAAAAAVQATKSAIASMESRLSLTKTRQKQYKEMAGKNAASQFTVEHWDTEVNTQTDQVAAKQQEMAAQQQQYAAVQQQLAASEQQLAAANQQRVAAEAQLNQARINLQTSISVRPAALAQIKSQVEAAKWSLQQTTVVAPEDGYVTQLQLQPGAMASPMGALMVFVYTKHRPQLRATIVQNYLNTFKPGAEAEVVMTALPGRILKAKVASIQKATGSGQLDAGGRLNTSAFPTFEDRMFVTLDLESDLKEVTLPVGSNGSVSIRGEYLTNLFVIRQVIMRIQSYKNYVFAGY